MKKVTFSRVYDYERSAGVTVAYKAGREYVVADACAEAAEKAGALSGAAEDTPDAPEGASEAPAKKTRRGR